MGELRCMMDHWSGNAYPPYNIIRTSCNAEGASMERSRGLGCDVVFLKPGIIDWRSVKYQGPIGVRICNLGIFLP